MTFEPMFDDIGTVDLTGIEWIVIGTETGRREGQSRLQTGVGVEFEPIRPTPLVFLCS